jgi:hypothetical protein
VHKNKQKASLLVAVTCWRLMLCNSSRPTASFRYTTSYCFHLLSLY